MNSIDLFNYTDYRIFLRDWQGSVRGKRGFSCRAFAGRAGLGSSGHFKMVIDGKRNLGLKGLERFMNGLKLELEERLYFRCLVLWNQAGTEAEKVIYGSRVDLLRRCRRLMPEMREKVERLREEISALLPAELTKEEAALLTGQLLSAE
jgi:uncharacterized protein (TIGR02147 family)